MPSTILHGALPFKLNLELLESHGLHCQLWLVKNNEYPLCKSLVLKLMNDEKLIIHEDLDFYGWIWSLKGNFNQIKTRDYADLLLNSIIDSENTQLWTWYLNNDPTDYERDTLQMFAGFIRFFFTTDHDWYHGVFFFYKTGHEKGLNLIRGGRSPVLLHKKHFHLVQ